MKALKNLLSSTTLLVTLSLASSASASLYWEDRDPNSGNGPLAFLYEGGNWHYKSDFNILIDGFNPANHHVTKIQVWFAFADDQNDGSEKVDIVVGNQKLWNNQEVDGNHSNAPWSYHWLSMDVTGNLPIYNEISANGKIDYKVTIQDLLPRWKDREDTWLKIAHLKVWGDVKQVPDAGATVALMGLGLVGLAAARKRFR